VSVEKPYSIQTSEATPVDRASLMAAVRTVVVKVGTNVLSRSSGDLALARIHAIVEELADLKRSGHRVILVSSGAVSMGMHRLRRTERPEFLVDKQALAAIGQIRLMAVYQQAFAHYDMPAAQVLLTEDDFTNRHRYLNLRNTMSRLLEWGAIPIVNENDTVSTTEIEERAPATGANANGAATSSPNAASTHPGNGVFGDNDGLSSLVASKLGADLLLILSDVDGLYRDGPPLPGTGARPVPLVEEITPEVEAWANGTSARGRGGMASKLRSIRRATQSGTAAVIARGTREGVIRDVLAGSDVGTLFLPRQRLGSRKRWIAFAVPVCGTVLVNEGARTALVDGGKSLLFAGVVSITGDFRRGDVVSIATPDGVEFARGITNYSAEEAAPLLGKHSTDVARLAGRNHPELVHRDNLAIWE